MLRSMTSLYILREDKILMLYRVGSRVIEPSWVGIGGHFEPEEYNDPAACVLRELKEETGLTLSNIEDMQLRYVSIRHTGTEVRQNFYFFARLWEKLFDPSPLSMPVTAKSCINHYLSQGRFDSVIYGVLHSADCEPTFTPLTKEET